MKELKEMELFDEILKTPENKLVKQAIADGRHAIAYNCYMTPSPILGFIGQKVCPKMGVDADQRPYFCEKVGRIDFPTRTKSVSGIRQEPSSVP